MTQPVEAQSGSLVDMGKSAFLALVELVPRAAWRGIKGGFFGFFLGVFLGLAVAYGSSLLFPLPDWLKVTQLLWVPLCLGLGASWLGALNGLVSTLTEEIARRRLAARIYAIVKPACLAAANRVRGGQADNLAEELRTALDQRMTPADGPPGSLAQRVEHFVAMRSQRVLCFSAVRSVAQAKDRSSAVAALESLGVERLEAMMVETLEDMFSTHMLLAALVALVAASLPALGFAFFG